MMPYENIMSPYKLPHFPMGVRKVFYLALFCCLWSFNTKAQSIEGIWTEHWIDSDVDYVDTVSIEFKDQKLEIELLHSEFDWNPQFVNESFDGSILRFQVNANNVTNFFIFQRSDDPNQLFGKVYTWKGEIKQVYLVRKPNEKE